MLSIQSHVVRGYVGNRAATFPLQVRLRNPAVSPRPAVRAGEGVAAAGPRDLGPAARMIWSAGFQTRAGEAGTLQGRGRGRIWTPAGGMGRGWGRSVRMKPPGACCEHTPAPALYHRPDPGEGKMRSSSRRPSESGR